MLEAFSALLATCLLMAWSLFLFRKTRNQEREFQQLHRGIRALIRERSIPSQLEFRNKTALSIWQSLLAFQAHTQSKHIEKENLKEAIAVGSGVSLNIAELSETFRGALEVLKAQAGSDLVAVAILLRDDSKSEVKIAALDGLPRERLENPLLMAFDSLFDGDSTGKTGDWGYKLSSESELFDFRTFGVGLSLCFPLRRGKSNCGGIWLAFSESAGSLPVARRDFLLLLCDQLASSLTAAEKIHATEEQSRRERDWLLGMSHDLRTPGNSALYALRELCSGELGELGSEVRLRLSIVQRCLEDQLSILDDVLDILKHHKGGLVARSEEIPLAPFLKDVLTLYLPLAEMKNLKLDYDIASGVSCWFDPGHLRRILSNLLSNAVKYTDEGQISVSVTAADEEVIISVSDTGIGIPPDETDALFVEFSRLQNSANRNGVGLGLAISRILARLGNGELQFEGARQGGSVFSLRIPRTRSAEQRQVGSSNNHHSILLVDDDLATCRTNRRFLHEVGKPIHLAHTLKQAEELVATHQPDLIVTDLYLPDGSAWQLLEKLEKRDPPVPAILLSGVGSECELGEIEDRFGVAVLQKPVDRTVLRNVALRCLESVNFLTRTRIGPN